MGKCGLFATLGPGTSEAAIMHVQFGSPVALLALLPYQLPRN
jgi:hypothetical protein